MAFAVATPSLVLQISVWNELLVVNAPGDTDTPATVSPGAQGFTLRQDGLGNHTLLANGTAAEMRIIVISLLSECHYEYLANQFPF